MNEGTTEVLTIEDRNDENRPDGSVRVVTIEARRKEADATWEWTQEMIEAQERRSQELWDNLDDEERQATCVIVRDSLLRLVDDPNLWVPASLEPRAGERLDLLISISMSEVEDEVLARRCEVERTQKEATADLVALRDEMAAKKTAEDELKKSA